jgi:hypothetical protein
MERLPSKLSSLLLASALGCASATPAECPAPPKPKPEPAPAPTVAPPPAPAAEEKPVARAIATTPTGIDMPESYARAIARTAYLWGYPMVNMINRRATITQAPQPGLMNGVLPVAPQGRLAMLHDYIDPAETFVTCPNQDVVYGLGFFDLEKQPVIIQVPDFGDRFWVYAIYDIRTDQVGQLGKPYGSKPGFYALVSPGYKGKIPEGVTAVLESPSSLTNVIPRVFMNDTAEDRKAVQPLLNQIVAYPFEEFTGKTKTIEWSGVPTIPGPKSSGGETKWVHPDRFFEQLPTAIALTPPLPGEESLYEQFAVLLDAAAKNPKILAAITDEAKKLDETLFKDFFRWQHNGLPAGNGWNRSVHNAEWGRDYFNRAGTSKSNMFDNRPSETQYFYSDLSSDGAQLRGSSSYEVTFAKGELPPVKGFWSLTMYDDRHLFHPNPLGRYSLGTKNKDLKYNADGSLTLYAGNKSPGKDKESNWLPAPAGNFSLYIRAYWGEPGITEGTWKPPLITKK